jgi:hypothetical protein
VCKLDHDSVQDNVGVVSQLSQRPILSPSAGSARTTNATMLFSSVKTPYPYPRPRAEIQYVCLLSSWVCRGKPVLSKFADMKLQPDFLHIVIVLTMLRPSAIGNATSTPISSDRFGSDHDNRGQ